MIDVMQGHASHASARRRYIKPTLQGVVLALCVWGQAALAASHTHVIVIEGMKFSPEVTEVHVGDTVVWKNKDFFPHSATAEDRSFDSKEIATGGSWKFKARKAGEFSYICTLHPTMKGRLIVK
jgi:plastocyanin